MGENLPLRTRAMPEVRCEYEIWRPVVRMSEDGCVAPDGSRWLVDAWSGGNRIGSRGLDLLCDAIGTRKQGRVQYVRASAIGTGTAALGTPQGKGLGSAVYHGTVPYTKPATTGSWQMNRSYSIGSTYAMKESGLFVGTKKDALLRGTMYSRGTFAVRNVVSGDTITLNYRCGFTSG